MEGKELQCFDIILTQLELKQLYLLKAKIEKQISDKSAASGLSKLELARLQHEAINSKSNTYECKQTRS